MKVRSSFQLAIVILAILALCISATAQARNYHKDHPELKVGETFLGNFTAIEFQEIRWTTKRMGNNALSQDGVLISKLGWNGRYPVFVQKSEMLKAGIEP